MVDETILTLSWLEYRIGTPQTPMWVGGEQLLFKSVLRKKRLSDIKITHFLSRKTDRTGLLTTSICCSHSICATHDESSTPGDLRTTCISDNFKSQRLCTNFYAFVYEYEQR